MEEKKMDRRVRKTRKQLRQALSTLMRQKPLNAITVREIADMVDINRGTFYLHYKDVYDMLEQTENEMLEEFLTLLEDVTEETLNNSPRPFLDRIFGYLAENADLALALMGPYGDHAFINKLKSLLRERCFTAWAQRFRREEAQYFDYQYEFMVCGCAGVFQHWIDTGMQETPEKMAEMVERLIVREP